MDGALASNTFQICEEQVTAMPARRSRCRAGERRQNDETAWFQHRGEQLVGGTPRGDVEGRGCRRRDSAGAGPALCRLCRRARAARGQRRWRGVPDRVPATAPADRLLEGGKPRRAGGAPEGRSTGG